MMAEFRRGFMRGLGFWLVPVLLALVLAGGGLAVGFAKAQSNLQTTALTPSPTADPRLPEALRRNGVIGQVERVLHQNEAGRLLQVRDRDGKVLSVFVGPQTIVKRSGKRLPFLAIRVGDRFAGIGQRDKDGVFQAKAISLVGPGEQPRLP